ASETAPKIRITLPTHTPGPLATVGITATTAVITRTPKAYKGIAAAHTCILPPTLFLGNTDVLTYQYSGGSLTQLKVKN
ncbi:pilus assembly protein, partial [Pseudomonas syringae pv. tagetis]